MVHLQVLHNVHGEMVLRTVFESLDALGMAHSRQLRISPLRQANEKQSDPSSVHVATSLIGQAPLPERLGLW